MSDAYPVIERGAAESDGDRRILRFTLRLPHPVERVWAAVAGSEGLRGWLAAAEPFEPRIGGRVTLRWLNTDEAGNATVASGTVTAWDVERVAEYTLEGAHGRIRFHLEPPRGDHVVLRFTNEFRGDDASRPDRLAGWHHHFEYLVQALDGHPADWSAWTFTRWRELRDGYAAEDPGRDGDDVGRQF